MAFASAWVEVRAVAADIATRLGLQDPVKVSTGFDRPNLSFVVVPSKSKADKERRLITALKEEGVWWSPVDRGKVARFAAMARQEGTAPR